MEFTANREELLSAAQDALAVCPAKSPLPELDCAFLATEDGKLTVAGGNLQVALERRIPVTITEDGSAIIDAQLLVDMLRRLAGDTVTIKRNSNGYLELTSGEAFYGVSTLDSAKYPRLDIPFPEDTVGVTGIPALAKRTVFAVSETDDKPLMKCVHLTFSADGLCAVGSDSFRIAAAKGESRSKATAELLIPADSLAKLAKLVGNKDELRVGMTGNTVVFMKEDFLFSARLMQGQYFDSAKLLSSVRPSFIVLTDAALLRDAMSSVYAVIGEHNRFSLSFDGSRLRMTCESEYGASTRELDTVPLSGNPAGTFWYNPEKLLECFRALGGTMMLKTAANGMLVMETDELTCLQVPTREPKAVERIAVRQRTAKETKEKEKKETKPAKEAKPKGKRKKKEPAEEHKAA